MSKIDTAAENHHDQSEPTVSDLDSRERQAVMELVEWTRAPGHGMAFFEAKDGHLIHSRHAADGTIDAKLCTGYEPLPDGRYLLPYEAKPGSRREGSNGRIELVTPRPKLLEATGVFGRVATLGRKGFEQARQAAEADLLVAKARFRPEKRNQYSKLAGQREWRDRLVGNGMEDWIRVRRDGDIALMQTRLEWYYSIDTETDVTGIKRLRRSDVREQRNGVRNFVQLAEPYLTKVPPEAELLWRTVEVADQAS